jgi:uncharacterized integral membrane protein (TIGR00698 family)
LRQSAGRANPTSDIPQYGVGSSVPRPHVGPRSLLGVNLETLADRLGFALPGLLVCFGLAWMAILVRNATGLAALNPVVVALVMGIAIRAIIGMPAALRPGAAYVVRPVLRAAIVILGLQVTAGQLLSIGGGALALAIAAVVLTIPFTIWLGARLGVDAALAQLIGTGTGICGASAIVAANQVARGKQEDVAYALAIITICGTASLILYPVLGPLLGLDDRAFGLWAGASIHEVVQAVGAAAAGGPTATEVGTVTKLGRVALLAPAVLALGLWVRRGEPVGNVKAPIPWFAFGFLAMVATASSGLVPRQLIIASRWLVPLMMAAAVAGLGLNTDLKALRERGIRPLLLGIGATLFISLLGLMGAKLM